MATDYGDDVSILNDWKVNMRTISGHRVVIEEVIKRLTDHLWYDPTFGYPLLSQLNASVKPSRLTTIQNDVEKEILKDERVSSADVTVVTDADVGSTSVLASPNAYVLHLDVQLTLDDGPTFSFIIPVNSSGFNVADLNIAEVG